MDEQKRRIGVNEAVFREANERIEDLNEAFATVTDELVLVCECGDGALTPAEPSSASQAASAASTWSACVSGFTRRMILAIRPSSSIRNVERSTPQ